MKPTKSIAFAFALALSASAALASDGQSVKIRFYSPKTVRITKMPDGAAAKEPTHRFATVLAKPLPPAPAFCILVAVTSTLIHSFGDCPLRSPAILTLFFVSLAAIPGFLPKINVSKASS